MEQIQYWKVKTLPFSGSNYKEIKKKSDHLFGALKRGSKRKTYIRSKYFNKQKIFFDYYWDHIFQKPKKQRLERLKLLPCAIELLEKCTNSPTVKPNPNKKTEILYRFLGMDSRNQVFIVQVKSSGQRNQFISVFPWK